MELPPHGRRIPRQAPPTVTLSGTTSACAENTHPAAASRRLAWNYLRVRGEYLSPCHQYIHLAELPPRARRILAGAWFWYCMMGTTSACAENTAKRGSFFLAIGNYLRVRGEYYRKTADHQPPGELPPRARRIPTTPPPGAAGGGTTSACAENTRSHHPGSYRRWNYLRVRGEYPNANGVENPHLELPPRARRIRVVSA